MLRSHADLTLRVEGRADHVGRPDANQALSEKRVAAVRQSPVDSHGTGAARRTSQGLGASRPAGSKDTVEGRQQHRRVELVEP